MAVSYHYGCNTVALFLTLPANHRLALALQKQPSFMFMRTGPTLPQTDTKRYLFNDRTQRYATKHMHDIVRFVRMLCWPCFIEKTVAERIFYVGSDLLFTLHIRS